jgi:endonuclease YncB( thermonuclease family)
MRWHTVVGDDGDAIDIRDIRIRFNGIDAPEK